MEKICITNQLQLLEKYNLTVEELFVIDLLFRAGIDENHPEHLLKYYNLNTNKTNLRDILISLQNKSIIIKEYRIPKEGQKFDPETISFNKNFLKNYRKFSGQLGLEFFNMFPSFAIINGSQVNLKNWAKKFNSEEDLYFTYGKNIGWNQTKHEEILELLKWAKDNNVTMLNVNIADFVISKSWDRLKELKEGDYQSITFDNTIDI